MNKCAQCKKDYKKGTSTQGCPKCAKDIVISEEEFVKDIKSLCTPQDWAAIARSQAMDILGSPEAATFLADATKFDLCHSVIQSLKAENERLKGKVMYYEGVLEGFNRPVAALLKA
jgi:hypothetical protein